jgi:mediator of RNA polymerase II transcription subunit 12
MWANHGDLLNEIMTNAMSSPASHQHGLDEVHQMIVDNFSDIRRRNEAMLFYNTPRCTTASLSSAMSDIQVSGG